MIKIYEIIHPFNRLGETSETEKVSSDIYRYTKISPFDTKLKDGHEYRFDRGIQKWISHPITRTVYNKENGSLVLIEHDVEPTSEQTIIPPPDGMQFPIFHRDTWIENEILVKQLKQIEARQYLDETMFYVLDNYENNTPIPENIKEQRSLSYNIIRGDTQTTNDIHRLNLNDSQTVTKVFLTSDIKYGITEKEAIKLVNRRNRLKGFKKWDDVDKTWYIGKDDINSLQRYFYLGSYVK